MKKKDFLQNLDSNILEYFITDISRKDMDISQGILLVVGKSKKQIKKELLEHDGKTPFVTEQFEILLTKEQLEYLLKEIK